MNSTDQSPTISSPLTEVDPAAIAELFNRDPETLTDTEVNTLIAEYRKRRSEWLIVEEKTKAKPKGAKGIPVSSAEIEDLLKGL